MVKVTIVIYGKGVAMNRIHEVIAEQGTSQGEVSRSSGLAKEYISKIANGHIEPRIKTARKLADALGVGIDDLFPGAPTKKGAAA